MVLTARWARKSGYYNAAISRYYYGLLFHFRIFDSKKKGRGFNEIRGKVNKKIDPKKNSHANLIAIIMEICFMNKKLGDDFKDEMQVVKDIRNAADYGFDPSLEEHLTEFILHTVKIIKIIKKV